MQRAWRLTGLSALAGLTVWMLLFFLASPKGQDFRQLVFPESQDMVVQFEGEFDFKETTIISPIIKGYYKFNGTLRAESELLYKGASFNCLFDEFIIRDENNKLILHFQRFPHALRYRVDPSFTEDERRQIFLAFHINTEESNPADDQSILQEPFNIFVTHKAKISNVTMGPILKAVLHHALGTHPGSPILKQYLSHPDHFPSLFNETSTTNRWYSDGFFMEPITFIHAVQLENKNIERISTHAKSRPPLPRERSYSKKGWIGNHNKKITLHDWRLNWEFDSNAHQIKSLDLDLQLKLEGSFMAANDELEYNLKLKTTMDFEQAKETIAPAPDEFIKQ